MNNKIAFALTILLAACWGTPGDADTPFAPGARTQAAFESLFSSGPLSLEMTQEKVSQVLGPPSRQIETWFDQSLGLYKKEWLFPELGVELAMTGPEATGPFKVRSLTLEAPWQQTVANGVSLGMPKEQACQRFEALQTDDLVTWSGEDPSNFGLLLNSRYTIIALNFQKDAIRRIYLGPGPG